MRLTTKIYTEEEEEIIHFSLYNVLPEGTKLALNTKIGMLSLLTAVEGEPYLLQQDHFTINEMSVLVPILDAHPYHCSYEVLLASFNSGQHITETAITRYRERLQEAKEEGVWDQEMRPIRNVLSRTRLKTRNMGIEISSILETGYVIIPRPLRRHKTV